MTFPNVTQHHGQPMALDQRAVTTPLFQAVLLAVLGAVSALVIAGAISAPWAVALLSIYGARSATLRVQKARQVSGVGVVVLVLLLIGVGACGVVLHGIAGAGATAVVAVTLFATYMRTMVSALALIVGLVALAGSTETGFGLFVPVATAWAGIVIALVTLRLPDIGSMSRIVRIAAPTIAISTVIGTALWLIVPPQAGTDPLGNRTSNALRGQSETKPGAPSSGMPSFDPGSMDLSARGGEQLTSDVMFTVPQNSPYYWRAGVLSEYSGTEWTAPNIQLGGIEISEQSGFFGSVTEVRHQAPELGNVVFAPGIVNNTEPSSTTITGLRRELTVPSQEYSVVAVPQAFLYDGKLINSDGSPWRGRPSFAEGRPDEPPWHQLPDSVTDRTRDLARKITSGAHTDVDKANAIISYLRSRYPYNLTTQPPPADTDPVDYFLFESREGFCQDFAAAFVVLARLVGLPARVAVGYAGGAADGDRRSVQARNAHAWAEVWLSHSGWTTVEPTSSSAAGHRLTSALLRLFDNTWVRWMLAGLLLLGLALTVWCVRLPTRRTVHGVDTDSQASLVHDDLVVAGVELREELAHHVGPSATRETLRGTASRAGDASREPIAVLEQHLYSATSSEPYERLRAAERLREHAQRLRAQRMAQSSSSSSESSSLQDEDTT